MRRIVGDTLRNLAFLLLIHRSLSLADLAAQQLQAQQNQPAAAPASGVSFNSALATANNIKPLIQAALAVAPSVATNSQQQEANSPISAQQQQQQPQPQPQLPQQPLVSGAPKSSGPNEPQSPNYGNEDPITYLDYSTINDEVLHRRTVNLVYFNANFSHCRYCSKFFNIWKDLAADIRWWKQVVRLFTINCSEEDNIEVCRRAGVAQFPQVKYYWIMSNSLEHDGQRLRILGRSVHAMRHLITDKVLDSYSEHNKLLAQRVRSQQQSRPQVSGSLVAPGVTMAPQVAGGSLAALMSNPMISQLLASLSGGASPAGSGSIMTLISGKGGSGGSLNMGALMSSMGGAQGLNQLMSAMMNAGAMMSARSVQPLPNNWPGFEPIEVTNGNTQNLLNLLPLDSSKNIGALLIMETQEFLYSGIEVMLDLIPYSNQTYIARVRDERSQLSKNLTKRDDIQAPALIYVTPLRETRLIITAPKYTNDEDLRRAFVRAFERRQVKYPVKRVWTVPSQQLQQQQQMKLSTSSGSQEDEDLLMNKINKVYMNDLNNAIRMSLMDQVFRHLDLSDDQYNALVKYVYTLINYFPFNNEESLKFFKRLHTWLQNQVSPMDINEYKKQFHDIEEVFPKRDWVACKSLSNTNAIPSYKNRKSLSLFENPAQLGKMVSNITRLFRGQQQQTNKLRSLFSMFAGGATSQGANAGGAPVSPNQRVNGDGTTVSPNLGSTSKPQTQEANETKRNSDSPIERIIKSLTSGSLGSDSSILKLISTALTGSSNEDAGQGGGGQKFKFAREYPCGAWKLAHVMVVNEYIRDSPRKDVKHIVLHSLYQYMLQFYACPTCGNRVSDVIGEFRLNLDEHLQDQGDSVFLLWKIHNRVSKRLEGELRPGSPAKVQFPSESLCPKCRAPRAQNELVSTPNWHEKQVLNFLVHHYRPQIIITSANSTSSESSSAQSKAVASRSSSLFYFALLVVAISNLSNVAKFTSRK